MRMASTGCAPVEHREGGPPDTRGTRDQRGAAWGIYVPPPPPASFSSQLSLDVERYIEEAKAALSAPSEGGFALPLLDTREQPVVTRAARVTAGLERSQKRARLKKETNERVRSALNRVVVTDELLGRPADHFLKDARFVSLGWRDRMEGCGDQLWLSFCPTDGHVSRQMDCCHVPVCSFEQSREANKWKARGREAMAQLPEGVRWHKVRKLIGANADKFKTKPTEVMGWKMITMALRDTGDLALDIRRAIGGLDGDQGLRKRLSRQLSKMGAVASYSALDVGAEHGHVHLHVLCYAPFLPRAVLQHWLQSQDCSKPGCKHVAGDRSCEGSWDVDIRKAWSPDECLKYSIGYDNPDQEQLADLHVAVYLTTYGRHRIETYGLAKPGQLPKVDAADPQLGVCPLCGTQMIQWGVGKWDGSDFQWTRAGPS